ncbi:acetyl-CoA C-acetyltransferase [Novosphingobium hassiacum]|uniref:Acetyl-CoA C-acetyltransferase n=1 Tax=Novosphingobium hassiacum TaxID=173676 RepID=A0A7W6EW52_9SPHN|nr:acetyl-CoA acetyltransferase [Novosphingobium hassiacum]MBB3860973.1 acetyl-CoA C-acetyltransferase [Novosphingobium hassiacum]
MTDVSSRIPVIVGVGQINDRPANPIEGLDSAQLMAAALLLADQDAGGGWLADADMLAIVDQMSFRELNPVGALVADAVGATPRIIEQTEIPSGDSPTILLNEAANRIASGEVSVAAIVGGEALRTAAARAAAASGGERQNIVRAGASKRTGYRFDYGLATPTDVYPLYENGCRAAWGQSLDEAQRESGTIWSRFAEAAQENPGAWIRKPVSAEEIIEPNAGNRRIAFPYNKLMVANSSVNQGAGFIVTSLAEARRRGVPEERIVFVGLGAAAHEPEDPLARDGYASTPAMAVSLNKALELNQFKAAELDFVELYSCFPCVPKMARRVLDWPIDKPATVFGGLTFGGGPIGNYMSHAVVGMVQKLRSEGGKGLLFANGGYATHNHSIVLSSTPIAAAAFPQDYHFQAEADAARGPVPPLVPGYCGPGTIETYTVIYDRVGEPSFGVVVGRSPAGERFLAQVPASDEKTIAFLTNGQNEPVGTAGEAIAGDGGLVLWTSTGC